MTLPSDQLGDMSDLLSAIQSDIQRSAKDDEEAHAAQQAEPVLQTVAAESAFDPVAAPQHQTPQHPAPQHAEQEPLFDPHNEDGIGYAAAPEAGAEHDHAGHQHTGPEYAAQSHEGQTELLGDHQATAAAAPVAAAEDAGLEFTTEFTQEAHQHADEIGHAPVSDGASQDPFAAAPVVAPVDPNLSLMVPSDAVAFAIDADSRAVITSMFGPGSEQRVLDGDISATINYLTQNTCPSMVIVDLSSAADPMSELDGLADVCTPGTVVLTLGATNDIGLYRRLRSAGVADYVVKPLNAEVLAEAIRGSTEPQTAAGASGTVQGKLICVVGARGGVGATTIATNCATLIADEVGKKVGLIDFDLQFGTVALTLDMETSSGLSEAIDNPSRVDGTFIDSVSVRAGERLFVIASEDGIEDHAAAAPENVAEFLNQLRSEFEVVVVDVPRHSAARWMRAFSNVSKLMVVTDLSLSGLRDTGRLLAAAKDVIEPSRTLMVANRVGGDKYGGIDQAEFENAIERKFDFVVADDAKSAGAAARAGKPIVQVGKDGKLAGHIREICGSLVKKPAAAAAQKSKKKSKLRLPFIGGKEA